MRQHIAATRRLTSRKRRAHATLRCACARSRRVIELQRRVATSCSVATTALRSCVRAIASRASDDRLRVVSLRFTIADLYDRISPARRRRDDRHVEVLRRARFRRRARDPFYGLDRRGRSIPARPGADDGARRFSEVRLRARRRRRTRRRRALAHAHLRLPRARARRAAAAARRPDVGSPTRARLARHVSAPSPAASRRSRFATARSRRSGASRRLHHAEDRRRALAELFRVLRPGSTLALHEIVRRSDGRPDDRRSVASRHRRRVPRPPRGVRLFDDRMRGRHH